jgi:protein-L-isoaspartate(D-aspartate) O-methyltransferase
MGKGFGFAGMMVSSVLALALLRPAQATEVDVYAERRSVLMEIVEAQVRELALETGLERLSTATSNALRGVERHRFVPPDAVEHAYLNRPLPIGHGQTISQPFIVALMTDLLAVEDEARVLEVGTGSGYQAAVLSAIVNQVYSIEIVEPLAAQVSERLRDLGYDNVTTRLGDGYHGWPEHGPFDGIIVTAAAGHVPPPLIEQLKPGGRMVIPVGSPFRTQMLMLLEKSADGELSTRQILPVRFVPLTGDH